MFYSTFVFPIYGYDPASNEVVSENRAGAALYGAGAIFLFWGVSSIVRVGPGGWGRLRLRHSRGGQRLPPSRAPAAARWLVASRIEASRPALTLPTHTHAHALRADAQVFVDPLGIGASMTSLTLVALLLGSAHLISTAPRTLSASTLCCDDAVFAEAGLQAQESFESRGEELVVKCDEYRDADAAEKQACVAPSRSLARSCTCAGTGQGPGGAGLDAAELRAIADAARVKLAACARSRPPTPSL